MLVSLYTARVVLNTLGASDFGLYNVVGGVIVIFGVLKSLISAGTQRFLTYEMGKGSGIEKLAKVFQTSLSIFVIIGGVIFVLGETIGLWFVNAKLVIPEGRETAANLVYQVSIVSMLVSTVQVPYVAAITSHERMDIYGYIGIAEPLIRLVFVFLLPILSYDKLMTYAVLMLLHSIIFTILYVIICVHLFEECKFILKVDKMFFKSMIGFTSYNMLESLSNMLSNQGQDILLNMFFGTTINASKAVATQVNNATNSFGTNFLIATYPQITKTYAAGQKEECNNLMLRASKFAYIIIAILMIPLFLNTDYILVLWLKNPPEGAALFCQLILVSSMIRIVSEPLYTGIMAAGKIKKYQMVTSSLTLLNIPICYVLFKIGLPAYYALCVTILMNMVLVSSRLHFAHMEVGIPLGNYIKTIMLNCFLVTVVAIVPLLFFKHLFQQNLFHFCIVTIVSVIWSVIVYFMLSLNKEERQFVIKLLQHRKEK